MGKRRKWTAILLAAGMIFAVAAVGCKPESEHTHEYGEWTIVREATCGEKGLKEKTCSCGAKTEEEISATGEHNYGWITETEATCGAEGKEKGICSVCGNRAERTLPAAGEHNYAWTVKKGATCVSAGEKEGICSVCGKTITEDIPSDANAHTGNYSEWTTEKQATCNEKGKRFRFCLDCGAKTEEDLPIDPEAHVLGAPTKTVASTCSQEGMVRYRCKNCKKVIEKALPLDPDAHTYGEPIISEKATCTKEGKKTSTCTSCKKEQLFDIPSDPYAHGSDFTVVDNYKICSDCKGLLDKQLDIVNAGKYQNYYEIYLDGAFDVEFTFHNKSGDNAEWHNFIFDIAPVTYLDGKRECVKNGTNPITPVIPWWTTGYYGQNEHPFLHVLDGSKTVATSWFLDEIEDTSFAYCMKKGVDVTASFKRVGTDVVDVKVVMTTTNQAGVLRTCTLTATLGYKGVPALYIALTGESNTVNLKQVKIKEGTLCPEIKTETGVKLLENATVDNVNVKNADGKNLVFESGDFDVQLDFAIASHNPEQLWHNYLVYLFKGKDANTGILNSVDGKLYMTMAGIGMEPDRSAIYHNAGTWFVQTADGVNASSVLGNATFKLRLSRKNGYITMFGNALSGGKTVAWYRYFSSINSDNEWYNHGYFDGDGIIRLTSENAAMTINAVTVLGGDVKTAQG